MKTPNTTCCKKTWYINSGNTCTPCHANKDKGIENRNWKLDVTCFYQHLWSQYEMEEERRPLVGGWLAPERKEGPLASLLTWKPPWRRDLCPFSSPSHLGKRHRKSPPLWDHAPGSAVGPGVGSAEAVDSHWFRRTWLSTWLNSWPPGAWNLWPLSLKLCRPWLSPTHSLQSARRPACRPAAPGSPSRFIWPFPICSANYNKAWKLDAPLCKWGGGGAETLCLWL